MEYEVLIKIKVDPAANYLEVVGNNCEVIQDQLENALYDLDDIEILDMDVLLC